MEQINSNPECMFTGIYADVDSTGTTDDNPEYQRMMRDAEIHRFDLLLCKSISRFGRNTLISIQTVPRLQSLGITGPPVLKRAGFFFLHATRFQCTKR